YCATWPRGINVAPGVSCVSSQKLRPLSGSPATCEDGTRWLTSADWVASSGTAASTVTSWVVSPNSRSRSRVAWSPVCRMTLEMTDVLKPLNPTVTEYSAGSMLGMEYWPVASVETVRTAPVPLFFSETLAPGRTPPELSLTTPCR